MEFKQNKIYLRLMKNTTLDDMSLGKMQTSLFEFRVRTRAILWVMTHEQSFPSFEILKHSFLRSNAGEK